MVCGCIPFFFFIVLQRWALLYHPTLTTGRETERLFNEPQVWTNLIICQWRRLRFIKPTLKKTPITFWPMYIFGSIFSAAFFYSNLIKCIPCKVARLRRLNFITCITAGWVHTEGLNHLRNLRDVYWLLCHWLGCHRSELSEILSPVHQRLASDEISTSEAADIFSALFKAHLERYAGLPTQVPLNLPLKSSIAPGG